MSEKTKFEPSFRNTGQHDEDNSKRLQEIAEMTLAAIEDGTVTVDGISHNITPKVNFMKENTRYYGPDSQLSTWSTARPLTSADPSSAHECEISIVKMTTLRCAQTLHNILSKSSSGSGIVPGILNFGDATSPGGGFLIGLPTQEETIARSSTLYPSLMTDTAQQFYNLHRHDEKGGFYHHAFVYTPASVVMRDDAGNWVPPYDVDVLTSAAVNAGMVRRQIGNNLARADIEKQIEATMRERMARILFLFEQQGSKNIVLGSFGTGVFRNNVEMVARLWSELLFGDAARFNTSFDSVLFGVVGEKTFMTFKDVFNEASQ